MWISRSIFSSRSVISMKLMNQDLSDGGRRCSSGSLHNQKPSYSISVHNNQATQTASKKVEWFWNLHAASKNNRPGQHGWSETSQHDWAEITHAGTLNLPWTGPLWAVSFLPNWWAVALHKRLEHRASVASFHMNPDVASPLNRAVIFIDSHFSVNKKGRDTSPSPLPPLSCRFSADTELYLSRTRGELTCFQKRCCCRMRSSPSLPRDPPSSP